MQLIPIFPDVDDYIPHSSNINLNKVLHDLEKFETLDSDGLLIIFWGQTEKHHIFFSTQENETETVNVKSFWTFEPHVRSLYKKTIQKLNVFARIAYSLIW